MKQKKKLFIVLTMVCMLLINAVPALANSEIAVLIDGNKLEFDVPPQILNDRTMVPMRKIFESLGAVVTWDESSRTATGKKDGVIVNVSIDSKTLFKNGEPKVLDVAPALIDGRTLVPVRAIAESFDCKVDWIAETRTVEITTDEPGTTTKTVLTASEISEKVSPSVFYIEVYDQRENTLGSGSGFFISASGVAVTNYHVIEGSYSALIQTTDGEIFDVTDVIAYDKDLDVAIIRIGKTSWSDKTVSGFPSAQLADSDNVKAGQTVYALGSPRRLQNTISNGIISNPRRTDEDGTFIQITAPISPGSSGGALVNEYGEVLGITTSYLEESQNINFAIPINVIKQFDTTAEGVPFSEFADSAKEFVLDIYPETIEITVGETAEVLVYAEGKGDWSVYWDTEHESIVDCEWGDWLEEYPSVLPLYITGLRAGTATVMVYSDVDFQGKCITVHVKQPAVATYPGTNIPTYTAITGVNPSMTDSDEHTTIYIYSHYNVNTTQKYVDYLLNHGFTYLKEEKTREFSEYFYLAPSGDIIAVTLAFAFEEVWVILPN